MKEHINTHTLQSGLTCLISGHPPQMAQVQKHVRHVAVSSSSTQQTVSIFTANEPCTFTGLRWTGSVYHETAIEQHSWHYMGAILLPEGQAVSTLDLSGGAFELYKPPQQLLASQMVGTCYNINPETTAQGPTIANFEGITKTARRLKPNDEIRLIFESEHLLAGEVDVIVTFFIKS